jgi:uncharacterized membrane protein (GlpM family)
MIDPFLTALLAKAAATALVVVAATAAAERFGPFWGGLVSCLPVAAGPGYVMLAMEQSPEFIADAALTSLAAGTATWAYLVTFVRLAQRWTLWSSLMASLALWLVMAIAVRAMPWTLIGALFANAIVLAGC